MNRERRKQLRQWSDKAEELKSELESILWDEQEYYDNIPENLQSSSRAEDSEAAIECLENAIDSVDEAINTVYDII